MNRRGFLQAVLAAGVAPYVVTTSGILMPVRKVWSAGTDLLSVGDDFGWYWKESEGGFQVLTQYSLLDALIKPNPELIVHSLNRNDLLKSQIQAVSAAFPQDPRFSY